MVFQIYIFGLINYRMTFINMIGLDSRTVECLTMIIEIDHVFHACLKINTVNIMQCWLSIYDNWWTPQNIFKEMHCLHLNRILLSRQQCSLKTNEYMFHCTIAFYSMWTFPFLIHNSHLHLLGYKTVLYRIVFISSLSKLIPIRA